MTPSGEDIDRGLVASVSRICIFGRVAITPDVVSRFAWPPMSVQAAAAARTGHHRLARALVPVEVEALGPDQRHRLCSDALGPHVDVSPVDAAIATEEAEIAELRRAV